MSDANSQKSINETLKVIKKALQEENIESIDENELILNQLVKNDGTIETIENNDLNKEEVKEILNEKLTKIFDENFEKWLNKNIPNYLEKYFSNKEK